MKQGFPVQVRSNAGTDSGAIRSVWFTISHGIASGHFRFVFR
jgi:hypothetical protein